MKTLRMLTLTAPLLGCGFDDECSFHEWWDGECEVVDDAGETDGHDGIVILHPDICAMIGESAGLELANYSQEIFPIIWEQDQIPTTVPYMEGTASVAGIFNGWSWPQGSEPGPAVLRTYMTNLFLWELSTEADIYWGHVDGSSFDGSLIQGGKTNPVHSITLMDGSSIAWAYVPEGIDGPAMHFEPGGDLRGFASPLPPVAEAGPAPSNTKSTSSGGMHFWPTVGKCRVVVGLDSTG